LFGNWFYESILARRGVAFGDIDWVDQPSIDQHFKTLTNFRFARVYGGGLVEAVELERNSGPGAVCFLSQGAAEQIAAVSPQYVLSGLTPMLVWVDQPGATAFQHLLASTSASEKLEMRKRHVAATLSFLKQVITRKKFAPARLVDKMLGITRPPNRPLQPSAHPVARTARGKPRG
jgi:hypothetical protein